MSTRWWGVLSSRLVALPVLADGASASRPDSVQKSKLRSCTPMKSAWPTRLKDFLEDCDVAVGGISVTLDQWPHLAKASGEYDRIAARWLR